MTELVRAPSHKAPFSVDAIVLEEDTGLVLSAASSIRQEEEHPIRVMTDLVSFEFPKVGAAVLQEGYPCFLFAVVIDLEQSPYCQETWVRNALRNSLSICAERKMKRLALQQLGCIHGKIDPEWFESELLSQLGDYSFSQVWLMDIK